MDAMPPLLAAPARDRQPQSARAAAPEWISFLCPSVAGRGRMSGHGGFWMSNRIARTCLALAALTALSAASSVQAPPAGPEYLGVVEAHVNGTTRQLERQRIVVNARIRLGGLGGIKSNYEMPGARSPVRFAAGQQVEFIVRVASQEADPQTYISFYRLDSKKKKRIVTAMRADYGGATNTLNRHSVAFDARKHGTQFFRLVPLGPLTPGEYMITATSQDGFLFGVD